jgi:XRE family transcriptional regulator, master regulator for biofilm formation
MIGERIKKLREKKGYSITELAEYANVSKSYLSYIERNLQNNPSLQFLSKIATPLGTTIEYLLGDDKLDKRLDEEWKALIQNGIDEGMSKEDFRNFREFVRFKKWQEKNRND